MQHQPRRQRRTGVLSRFEHMCKAIAYMYELLEKQVEEKPLNWQQQQ